LFTPLDTETLS